MLAVGLVATNIVDIADVLDQAVDAAIDTSSRSADQLSESNSPAALFSVAAPFLFTNSLI